MYDVAVGPDYRKLYFDYRLTFINAYISDKYGPIVRVVPTYMVGSNMDIQTFLADYLREGYEGQILRVADSIYEHKRSKGLLKHKEFEDAEFEIVRIEEGEGNWSQQAKSIEIRLEDGSVQSSGVRGSMKYLEEVLQNKDSYIGTKATVRYQKRTADGKLRFPVVTTLWKGERDL